MTKRRTMRFISVGSTFIVILAVARIIVLFLEAMSQVKDERFQDTELLILCREGAARGSSKMRIACLQAEGERSSPIVLKGMLRAVNTLCKDISEAMASPFRFLLMMLVLTTTFMPMQTFVQLLFGHCEPTLQSASHIVVVASDAYDNQQFPAEATRAMHSRLAKVR